MTDTRDKDMDMTEHLCTTTEAHDRFIDHTANTIVAIAESVHPGDPVAAAMLALRAAGWQEGEVSVRLRREPLRPMDTSDIDPETGEEFGVGPDIDPDDELSAECERDLEEQEAER